MTATIVVVFKWNGPWFFINLLRLRGSILFVRYWTICNALTLDRLNEKKTTRIREYETNKCEIFQTHRGKLYMNWKNLVPYHVPLALYTSSVRYIIMISNEVFLPFSCCLFRLGVDCCSLLFCCCFGWWYTWLYPVSTPF